jgi:hypothetical protein
MASRSRAPTCSWSTFSPKPVAKPSLQLPSPSSNATYRVEADAVAWIVRVVAVMVASFV